MTVKNIYDFLNQKFPSDTALGFDNVGILIGDNETNVTKAMVALDCTQNVIESAVENGCELIITHHPVIFSGLKSILSDSIVFNVLKNKLSVISLHTNLDQGNNGVNDNLCRVICLENITDVIANDGFILRKGSITPTSCDNFAKHLKKVLNYPVKYVGNNTIKNVLVCSGSGSDYLNLLEDSECDALVTSEVKHHLFLEAAHKNLAVFDCGHFNTEVVVIKPLTKMLNEQFCDIKFISNCENIIKTAE